MNSITRYSISPCRYGSLMRNKLYALLLQKLTITTSKLVELLYAV